MSTNRCFEKCYWNFIIYQLMSRRWNKLLIKQFNLIRRKTCSRVLEGLHLQSTRIHFVCPFSKFCYRALIFLLTESETAWLKLLDNDIKDFVPSRPWRSVPILFILKILLLVRKKIRRNVKKFVILYMRNWI